MNKKLLLAIILIILIVVGTALVVFKVEPIVTWAQPLTSLITGFSWDKLNSTVIALCGTVGGLISGLVTAIWQAFKLRGNLKAANNTIAQKNDALTSMTNQNQNLIDYSKTQSSAIDAAKAEKDQALSMKADAENQLSSAQQKIHDQEIQMQTLTNS